jgi:AraC family transcriptional regulator
MPIRPRVRVAFAFPMGRSPCAFINEQRVEQAKHLLAQPQHRSLTEIAQACGFSDQRRFRLVFERLPGATPSRFRESAFRRKGATQNRPA